MSVFEAVALGYSALSILGFSLSWHLLRPRGVVEAMWVTLMGLLWPMVVFYFFLEDEE